MKLSKVYEPGLYETDIYALWEKTGAFKPLSDRDGKGKPFSIVMPPPNANGDLHMGHALTAAVQDVAVRYHRQKGCNALLLPGADHAGFETQVVYERQLAKEGKSRFDYTREELYANIWDFVASYRGHFETQVRRLGIGCDWSRFTFTLDDKIVNQAYATFKEMWEEGLIYRGERLVNFCTFHGTAFADIEVAFKEETGKLWYIRYPLTDGSGELVVATTRPETMLGDTGVAVHPDDPRYHTHIGKTVRLPLTNREIPVIADTFVDPEFGTGAVKLTPAHDINDYDAGERHDLPKISVIDHEGKISHEAAGNYHGLPIEEARRKIVDDLEAQGLLLRSEDLTHNVGHCYKCDTVIQPLLREQWFVDMKPLATKAIEALQADKITFYPEAKKIQLITYLQSLRDWNISRQIAWGIPIPAFRNVDDPTDWIYDERVTEELIEKDGKTYHRDPDVFDTWFSSSSWPYATLNYPDGQDYKDFYPLNLMETGFDILMPWVSRMIMLGLYVTGEVPFTTVYLHGLVLDPEGQKMSKSKGNVVNPIEVADEYGSDALRMGMLIGQTPGNNQPYISSKVVGARNFCNKLWNIARFVEDKIGDSYKDENFRKDSARAINTADHWMLSKLQQTADIVAGHLEAYRFSEAYDTLYHFVWDDFADWYIEASKPHKGEEANNQLLVHALESTLKLAHPFAPFVTETIWQTLAYDGAEAGDSILASQRWPKIASFDAKQAASFEEIKAVITEARFITKTLGVQNSTLYYNDVPVLGANAGLIARMARLAAVTEVKDGTGVYLTDTKYRCWLDIDRGTAEAYQTQLIAKKAAQEQDITRLEGRLANKAYVHDAPKQIVEQTRTQLEEARTTLRAIQDEYERFAPAKTD